MDGKLGPYDLNTVVTGDALELAKALPANSIHCIVTSPPYWGLRDYGTATWEGGSIDCDHKVRPTHNVTSSTLAGGKQTTGHWQEGYKDTCSKCGATRIDQQLGLEETPEEYIEKMGLLFRELRRVLRQDGTLWLNMGDSYASSPNGRSAADTKAIGNDDRTFRDKPFSTAVSGLKPKDLCGIPWMLAFALRADGWYLRSDIIWSKPNPMPESVTDRPTKAHEYLFLLTKSSRYFYDIEATRQPLTKSSVARISQPTFEKQNGGPKDPRNGGEGSRNRSARQGLENLKSAHEDGQGRNLRTVWDIPTQPYPEAHFATFPEALIEPCILAGTSAKGVCPACGSQWERVTEKGEFIRTGGTETTKATSDKQVKTNGFAKSGMTPGYHKSYTTGWRPTCNCIKERAPNFGMKGSELLELADEVAKELAPVPAIVLDPFMGSGTTASVAKEHGRHFLGFELNPNYTKLAQKRINETQPPLFVI